MVHHLRGKVCPKHLLAVYPYIPKDHWFRLNIDNIFEELEGGAQFFHTQNFMALDKKTNSC